MTAKQDIKTVNEVENQTRSAIGEEYRNLDESRRLEIEIRLKRKLDIRLFPTLLVFYLLNFIDRNALAAARLLGLEDDLKLTSTQYETCISILYVGYLIAQVPSNLVLTKLRPSLYLPACMIVWGIVAASCAGTHNFTGIFLIRFFLGFCEAPFFPGAVFLLSSWYTTKELNSRMALLYGGSLLSGSFGSLIAIGITDNMEGARGLRAWRWLFIIEGAMTVAFALVAIFVLPDFPSNTRWMTPEERLVAQGRLLEDIGQEDTNEPLLVGAKKMIKDVKVHVLALNQLLITFTASFTNYFPTLTHTISNNTITAYALLSPPYLLAFAATIFFCHHADKTRERTWHIVGGLVVAIVGLVILASATNTGARYFAMILMPSGVYVAYDTDLTWVSNSIPRTAAKRAASIAFVNMIGNIGNLAGGYLYPKNQGPRYIMAAAVQAGASFISIFVTLGYGRYLKHLNKKMDGSALQRGEDGETEDTFRYVH